MNMAIDEAVLHARLQEKTPNTLRLYKWKPSAISIGKNQKLENEVQLNNCRKLGIDIVRRISGGGTVYHDAQSEITYSVIAKTSDVDTNDIAEVYIKIYRAIAEALQILGVNSDFNEGDAKNCPNLTVKSKKISGSAQAQKSGIFLQHGTLLLNVDLEKMFTLLRVPWTQSCMQVVNVAKNKITSLKDELAQPVSEEAVTGALIKGFERALNIHLVCGELMGFESDLANRLCKEKYASDGWNFQGKTT